MPFALDLRSPGPSSRVALQPLTSDGGLGVGTLLLALVVGLLGFALLLLVILLSDNRGRQLLVAGRAVWRLGLTTIRQRRLPESELRAETRRSLADAVQDLRSVLGDDPTAMELAERAAWDEHAVREDARARDRARQAREQAREKAAARVAASLNRAQRQAAEARVARERLEQLEADLGELPAAEAYRLASSIEAATARLLTAQRAAAAAEERAAAEIAAAEQAAAARVAAESAARAAAERAAADRAAAERAAADRAAADRAAADRAAADRAAADRAAAQRYAAEARVARERREQLEAERAAAQAEEQAEEQAVAERARLMAVEIDVRETARLGAPTGRAGGAAGLRLVDPSPVPEQEPAPGIEGGGPPEDGVPAPGEPARPRKPGVRGRSGHPASVGHSEPRRVVTSQVPDSGPMVLVPAVAPAPGPRPPVSWAMARGAPLVVTTGASYRRSRQVERTRRRLVELRQNDARSIRRLARQASTVRAALLAIAPGVVLWRATTDAGFLADALDGGAGVFSAVALAAAGSVLAWRVSVPPSAVLKRPSAKGDLHLLRSLFASEQLAVRLAAGALPSEAWRSVAIGNRFPVGSAVPAGTPEGALVLAEQSRRTILRRQRDLVRRRLAVTVLPVLALLLPAALLLAVL